MMAHPTWQTDATITKDDIPRLGKLKGAANAEAVTISGVDFPRGQCVFLGFRGAWDHGDAWSGVFVYRRRLDKEQPEVVDNFPISEG